MASILFTLRKIKMLFTSLGRSKLGKTVSGVSILSAALADGKDFPVGTPGW